jgi:hypothetical protein
LTAFRAATALPSGVRGPVDFWALVRLALVWASVAMMIPPNLKFSNGRPTRGDKYVYYTIFQGGFQQEYPKSAHV